MSRKNPQKARFAARMRKHRAKLDRSLALARQRFARDAGRVAVNEIIRRLAGGLYFCAGAVPYTGELQDLRLPEEWRMCGDAWRDGFAQGLRVAAELARFEAMWCRTEVTTGLDEQMEALLRAVVAEHTP